MLLQSGLAPHDTDVGGSLARWGGMHFPADVSVGRGVLPEGGASRGGWLGPHRGLSLGDQNHLKTLRVVFSLNYLDQVSISLKSKALRFLLLLADLSASLRHSLNASFPS